MKKKSSTKNNSKYVSRCNIVFNLHGALFPVWRIMCVSFIIETKSNLPLDFWALMLHTEKKTNTETMHYLFLIHAWDLLWFRRICDSLLYRFAAAFYRYRSIFLISKWVDRIILSRIKPFSFAFVDNSRCFRFFLSWKCFIFSVSVN